MLWTIVAGIVATFSFAVAFWALKRIGKEDFYKWIFTVSINVALYLSYVVIEDLFFPE